MAKNTPVETQKAEIVEAVTAEVSDAPMVPRMYQVVGGLADESVFEMAQESLDAIHETGGKVIGFAFQSPGKMAILAYVPPDNEAA